MAKANPHTGSSVYVPDGADTPDVDPGVRLVGPGVPGEPAPEPAATAKSEPAPEPAPQRAPKRTTGR